MNVMRYTVVEAGGTVSFVADCDLLPDVVSACAEGVETLAGLLSLLARRRPLIKEHVESGLAVFDEHNLDGNNSAIHGALSYFQSHETPVFRVVDERTRQASLQPARAGVVVFNLRSRRIVQIQNTYSEIRKMVGRVRRLEQAGWMILP